MKSLFVIAALVAAFTAPAFAQQGGTVPPQCNDPAIAAQYPGFCVPQQGYQPLGSTPVYKLVNGVETVVGQKQKQHNG